MNHSPYSPPQSTVEAPAVPGADIGWLTNALGTLVLLPGFLALIAIPFMWPQIAEQLRATPVRSSVGLASGAASLLAGGLLLSLRPLAVPALGLLLSLGLGALLASGRFLSPALAWCAPDAVAFVYALWLWNRGALRSRPNNSSKPTPLRGAA